MDITLTTLFPQTEDDEKALLQRLLQQRVRKVTSQVLSYVARTVTTSTADIKTNGYTGMAVMMFVGVASGTGGLTIRVQAYDTVGAFYVTLATQSVAVTTTGAIMMSIGPGGSATNASGPSAGFVGCILPETLRIQILHGDGSSYTYNVSVTLIP